MQEDLSDDVETIADLSRSEHLLVWALRAIAVGHGDCPLIAQTFARACGPMGGHALQAYFALVKFIGMSGRRRLRVHVPGCPRVSHDERTIVGIVAAAQGSTRGPEETLLGMRLRFLVQGEPHQSLLCAAQEVARVFAANGYILPLGLTGDGPGQTQTCGTQLRVVH